MTPEQAVARRKKAVAAAKALLSLEYGFYFGAQRIRTALSLIDEEYLVRFPAFQKFLEEVPLGTPTGQLRLLCQVDYLMASDKILATAEAAHRAALLQECLAVVRALGNNETRAEDTHK